MRLMMAQVDDVPGELLGEFISRAEALGARNVQIVSSVTKKGRPGYIVYIDVADEGEAAVAELLGAELGTWGYRVLAAEHKHFDIERFNTALRVEISAVEFDFDLRAKRISLAGRVLRIKAEHDDLAAICRALRDAGHALPLAVLKARVESALIEPGERPRLVVQFA